MNGPYKIGTLARLTGFSPALLRAWERRFGLITPERGDGRQRVYGDDDLNDTRCGACGSLLFSVVREGEYVHVAMGSLVDPPSIRPTEHIFVGSKAPWFEITDDLPQADELD